MNQDSEKVPNPVDSVVFKTEEDDSDIEDDSKVDELAMEQDPETDLPSSQNIKDDDVNSENGSHDIEVQQGATPEVSDLQISFNYFLDDFNRMLIDL